RRARRRGGGEGIGALAFARERIGRAATARGRAGERIGHRLALRIVGAARRRFRRALLRLGRALRRLFLRLLERRIHLPLFLLLLARRVFLLLLAVELVGEIGERVERVRRGAETIGEIVVAARHAAIAAARARAAAGAGAVIEADVIVEHLPIVGGGVARLARNLRLQLIDRGEQRAAIVRLGDRRCD